MLVLNLHRQNARKVVPRIISERVIVSKLIPKIGFEKLATALAVVVALAGCSTTNQQSTSAAQTAALNAIEHNGGYYLTQAQQATGMAKHKLLLLAARAYINNNQIIEAQQVLADINIADLSFGEQQLEYQLLLSKVLVNLNHISEAINALQASNQWQLSPQHWFDFYQYKMSLQLSDKQPISAAISLMDLAPHLTSPEQVTKNQLNIWQLLSQATAKNLAATVSDTLHFSGWQALALSAEQNRMSPSKLQQALAQWAIDYPMHPAVSNLPAELVSAVNVIPYAPQKVALLLPLSGRYARLGQAVQHGVIGNLTDRNYSPSLIVFDTEKLGAIAAYQQAIANGAEFIYGPLLKKNVALVSEINTTMPMLLLNKTPETSTNQLHYSFSLDKKSEAVQGSEYIFASGKQYPAIIAPNNTSGHQIAALFTQRWQQLNTNSNRVVESFFFDNDKELKLTVEKLFETNQSQIRINKTRALVGSKMKSETRSRRDIDAIYLVSNPQQTSMLKPSIDYTVSAFAPQVAVYVGSTGNKTHTQNRTATDLNRLNVSEQPWLLQLRDTKLSSVKIKQLWPKLSRNHQRFFAMGYDAFELVGYLAQMELFPKFTLKGFSGQLSLDSDNKISRQMSWAQYQRGQLVVPQ